MSLPRLILEVVLTASLCLTGLSCSSAPVVRSAKGNLQAQSQQIILSSVKQNGEQLVVAGRLYSPLHSVNKLTTRRSGRTMKIRMTQALLREGGRREFLTTVPLPRGVDQVTIGQDDRVIWSRTGGISSGITDQKQQTERAASDFDDRLNDFLSIF